METIAAIRPPSLRRLRPPEASDVHVFTADLDVVDVDVDVLCDDELERAASFRFERDRRRFVAGRSLLRQLLGAYLGAPARKVEFDYGEHGKPCVPGAELAFNVSHSGNVALYAFSSGFDLGADVELLDHTRADDMLVAGRFFSPYEIATLWAHPEPLRREAFLRCWTRKEAFIKARGDGFLLPLRDFDVRFGVGERPALLRTAWSSDEPHAWSLHDVSRLCPGGIAAIAAHSRISCVVHMGRAERITERRDP
ncbi:MAG TPA: 4'-phosphopantetheinyl transferase superfamily protein [Gaiellaceae bacterium]